MLFQNYVDFFTVEVTKIENQQKIRKIDHEWFEEHRELSFQSWLQVYKMGEETEAFCVKELVRWE